VEELIQKHEINELIFTHHYSDELRAHILGLKEKHDLLIRDFVFVLHELDEQGVCQGMLQPDSVHELDGRSLRIREDAANAAD